MAGGLKERRERMKANGLFFSDAILQFPKPTKKQKEMARKVLGDEDFPFFDALRCGTPEGRSEARKVLISRHYGLIGIVVRSNKWQRFVIERFDGSVDFDDLWNVGALGVAHALEAFDYTQGFRFSSYAVRVIDTHLSKTFMLCKDGVRIPAHTNDDMRKVVKFKKEFFERHWHNPSDEEILAYLTEGGMGTVRAGRTLEALRRFMPSNPTHSFARVSSFGEGRQDTEVWEVFGVAEGFKQPNNDGQTISNACLQENLTFFLSRAGLSDREKSILYWRFGLDDSPEKTLAEIGEKLNLSRERVRQL